MGELFKTQHTIDEMLDKMGVKIVLNGESLSEKDVFEAEKVEDSVIIKKKEEKNTKEEQDNN